MGNSTSISRDNNVFEKELSKINTMINSMINDKNLFIKNDYNFLSNDECDKYQFLLESELSKHLKVEINEMGQKLFVIPKDYPINSNKITKQQICEKVANHYLKILYIISLIKYVYNIEKNGDYSIAGIIFRNIKIIDDLMEIKYCDMPHKNPNNPGIKDKEIDFSELEGMKFLTDYFLDKSEKDIFLSIIKTILGNNSKEKQSHLLCQYINDKKNININDIQDLYFRKWGEKLKCNNMMKKNYNKKTNLIVNIENNNPVFSNKMCYSIRKIIIKINKNEGKIVYHQYLKMKDNYIKNVNNIHKILNKIIIQEKNNYELRNLTAHDVNKIIQDVKIEIQQFYIQSILDFQIILDNATKIPKFNQNV